VTREIQKVIKSQIKTYIESFHLNPVGTCELKCPKWNWTYHVYGTQGSHGFRESAKK